MDTLRKFANMKLEGVADAPEGCGIQQDLDRLEN